MVRLNVEVVLAGIAILLLSWVGITTHQSRLELERVSTTLELFAISTSGAIRRIDGELRDFDPRLRAVERAAARAARLNEFSTIIPRRENAGNQGFPPP